MQLFVLFISDLSIASKLFEKAESDFTVGGIPKVKKLSKY